MKTILQKTELTSDHPKNIAPSIAMKPIPKTSDLVPSSLSRFSKVCSSKPNQLYKYMLQKLINDCLKMKLMYIG